MDHEQVFEREDVLLATVYNFLFHWWDENTVSPTCWKSNNAFRGNVGFKFFHLPFRMPKQSEIWRVTSIYQVICLDIPWRDIVGNDGLISGVASRGRGRGRCPLQIFCWRCDDENIAISSVFEGWNTNWRWTVPWTNWRWTWITKIGIHGTLKNEDMKSVYPLIPQTWLRPWFAGEWVDTKILHHCVITGKPQVSRQEWWWNTHLHDRRNVSSP